MPLPVSKNSLNTINSLMVVGIMVVIGLYLVHVNSKITPFGDDWVLEGIFVDFIIVLMLLPLISYILFSNTISSSLFFNSIISAIILFTPLLKYVNAINLGSPHDVLAHYSFALWIVRYGHIAPPEKLYYTSTIGGLYSTHPGNGFIPAILHISTGIPLDYCMNLVLLLNYIGYIIIITLILSKIMDKKNFPHNNLNSNVNVIFSFILFLIVLLITSVIYISPTYGGVSISYLYVGLLFYYIFRNAIERGLTYSFSERASMVMFLIVYLGLISTHFSTTVITTFYFGLLVIVSFLRVKQQKPSISNNVIKITAILILAFLIYEVFVDTLMLRTTLTGAIQRIVSLYFRELREAEQAMERHRTLSLIDLVRYLIAVKTKLVYIAFVVIACLVVGFRTIMKVKYGSGNSSSMKVFTMLFLLSVISYIPAYEGVSSFESLVRVLPLLQVSLVPIAFHFLVTFISRRPLRGLHKNLLILPLIFLITFGYVSNYEFYPLAPTMRYNGEEYRIRGVLLISIYIYDSIRFLATHGSNTTKFITLSPYVTFGYADLLWNMSKIPRHGFISLSPDPEDAIEMIKYIINEMKNSIIPIYLTDKLSGRVGLKSYYEKPLKILKLSTSMIYNNKYYALFFSR